MVILKLISLEIGKCAEFVIISNDNNQNNSLRSKLFLTFKEPRKSKGVFSIVGFSGFYGSVSPQRKE